jgi:hypothetical protein
MDEITREVVSDILHSTLERIRRANDMLSPDSPAARELGVAQRLIDTCIQAPWRRHRPMATPCIIAACMTLKRC